MMRYAGAAVASVLLFHVSTVWGAEDCPVAAEQGGWVVPVERLTPESRCLLSAVMTRPSTSSAIGPTRTPIGEDLYGYLLDHPHIMVMLMERLGMGTYRFSPTGPDQFEVDDGDGARGVLTVVYRNHAHRIYYIDGQHRSIIFPTVQARTVVFLNVTTENTDEERPHVQTALVSYTQFQGRVLAGVARVFRPLVEWAVKRTLSREFDLTNQLGTVIAQDPDRVQREVAALSSIDSEDRRILSDLVQAVPHRKTPTTSASSP